MPVHIHGYPRPPQLRAQVGLAAIDRDQVRSQGENPLDVGIDERAHAWKPANLRREVIEAADGDHLRPGADGEQHFSDRGDQGHDASGPLR